MSAAWFLLSISRTARSCTMNSSLTLVASTTKRAIAVASSGVVMPALYADSFTPWTSRSIDAMASAERTALR